MERQASLDGSRGRPLVSLLLLAGDSLFRLFVHQPWFHFTHRRSPASN